MKIILKGIFAVLLIIVTCIAVGCSYVGEPKPSDSSKEIELKATEIYEYEKEDEQSESTIEKNTEKTEDDRNGKAESSESSKETDTKVSEIDKPEKDDEQSEEQIGYDTEKVEVQLLEKNVYPEHIYYSPNRKNYIRTVLRPHNFGVKNDVYLNQSDELIATVGSASFNKLNDNQVVWISDEEVLLSGRILYNVLDNTLNELFDHKDKKDSFDVNKTGTKIIYTTVNNTQKHYIYDIINDSTFFLGEYPYEREILGFTSCCYDSDNLFYIDTGSQVIRYELKDKENQTYSTFALPDRVKFYEDRKTVELPFVVYSDSYSHSNNNSFIHYDNETKEIKIYSYEDNKITAIIDVVQFEGTGDKYVVFDYIEDNYIFYIDEIPLEFEGYTPDCNLYIIKVTEIDESEKNDEQLEKNIEQAEVENNKAEETDNIELIIEPNTIIKDNIINNENLFGMWESSHGDSEGYSQLLIYTMDNKSFDFQFYNFQYIEVNGEKDMNQYGFSGTAIFLDEDIAEFKIDDNILVDFYSSVYGNFEFSDSTIQISFKYESYNRLHTIDLIQVNNEDIISKRAELPFYYRELRIMGEPVYNISLTNADELFGEPLNTKLVDYYENEYLEVRTYDGYEMKFNTPTKYSLSSNLVATTITKPGISIVRGIQVGDDIRDVINKFPNKNREIINEHGRFYLPLYGRVQHASSFGEIDYENGKPNRVIFSHIAYLVFELDDNLKVSSIRYY